jgi:hypothetical protein
MARLDLSQKHSRILDRMTAGLADPSGEGQSARTYNRAPDVYMPLVVERIGQNRYSVAHYFEQNGDRVPDPDIEFVRDAEGRWYPAAATMAIGTYHRVAEFDGDGRPTRYSPRGLQSVKPLARLLLDNASRQQDI